MSLDIGQLDANLASPAKTYLWDVVIPNPPYGSAETFSLRCQSSSIPERSLSAIKVEYKQTAGVKYPGKVKFPQSWALTFIEGEDRAIFTALNAWINSIVNAKTGIGTLVTKTDVYLKLLNTDGEEALSLRLIGVYPESLGEVSLNYTDEGDIKYPCTLSYDRWEEE